MITENLPMPPEPRLTSSRAEHDVLAERERQVGAEGWTTRHDDEHDGGDLATAGACYALNAACVLHPFNGTPLEITAERLVGGIAWPWELESWKPKDPRRDLVRAAALLIAEIERIDRQGSLGHSS